MCSEDPDPHAILKEARDDARAGRYADALAKHVWFHENALTSQPSLYGVRLSFALSDWMSLAEDYPPALTKLKEFRDQAKKNTLAGKDAFSSFHDMAAINEQLNEEGATQIVFETLDEQCPEIAKEVFHLAQPSLVRGKAYTLIGKYIVPEDDFTMMCKRFARDKRLAKKDRFGSRHLDFANKEFANATMTLVAILVVNDRKKEAEQIAVSARAEWIDSGFHAGLQQALKCVVPDPWP